MPQETHTHKNTLVQTSTPHTHTQHAHIDTLSNFSHTQLTKSMTPTTKNTVPPVHCIKQMFPNVIPVII